MTDTAQEQDLRAMAQSDAGRQGAQKGWRLGWRVVLEYLTAALAAIVIALVLRYFVLDMYEVPTGSMEPNIEIGDRVLAEKISVRFRTIERGDIVFFDDPMIPGRILVKRVIAVAGQEVSLYNGKVYIDGQGTFEPYTHGAETYPLVLAGLTMGIEYPYVVPDGYIWVLGDNREDSLDSRAFGAIPINAVLARAVFRVWPIERFGYLE